MNPPVANFKRAVYQAPAKINWFLEVLGTRDDGYHEIETVMQKIAWFDDLIVQPSRDGASRVSCSDPRIPLDERNTVLKALRALERHCGASLPVELHLEKRIPSGAGLGGGSSDAATTLRALNELFGLGCEAHELHALAASVGSDVAFFLDGPLALCRGRGELVKPLDHARRIELVLVWPGIEVSSKIIYKSGQIDLTTRRIECNFSYEFVGGLESAPRSSRSAIFNRLTAPCETLFAFVASSIEKAREQCDGRIVALSGSGSSFFVVCRDIEDASRIANRLKRAFPEPSIVKATHTLI